MKTIYSDNSISTLWKKTLIVLCSYLLLSLVLTPVLIRTSIFTYPDYFTAGKELLFWVITNSVLPSIVIFIMVAIAGWYLLPLSNTRYVLWLIRNNIPKIIKYFLILLVFIFSITAVYVSGVNSSDFNVRQDNLSQYQLILYLVNTNIITTIPIWLGYRLAWVTYVGPYRDKEAYSSLHIISGTRTRQDIYEDYIQDIETKNIGQYYDKYIERYARILSGADGSKPRGFLLWFIFSSPLSAVLIDYATSARSVLFISLIIFFITPSIILIVMFFTKMHDLKVIKRLPRLIPKRGYDDEDDYYAPDSIGVKKYERDV